MNQRPNSRQRKLQVLIVCLAVFALLFMATESTLAHHHAGARTRLARFAMRRIRRRSRLLRWSSCRFDYRWRTECDAKFARPSFELLAADHSSRAPPSA